MNWTYRTGIVIALCVLVMSCTGGGMIGSKAVAPDFQVRPIDSRMLERIAQRSIFFGHQSVGFNILDGISDVLRETRGVDLKVVESTKIGEAGRIYHYRVGRNGDPLSKIEDFARIIAGGIGNAVDVAFFKLCFVDFRPDTDAAAVFKKYRETMDRLQAVYPGTRLVHVTVPLTTRERGFKGLMKAMIGRARLGYEDNVVREQFNRLMREEYGDRGLVFDLARVESTLPDGSRLQYKRGDETYYALAPEYTTDGGHLNEVGRLFAAVEFLRFLSSLDLPQAEDVDNA